MPSSRGYRPLSVNLIRWEIPRLCRGILTLLRRARCSPGRPIGPTECGPRRKPWVSERLISVEPRHGATECFRSLRSGRMRLLTKLAAGRTWFDSACPPPVPWNASVTPPGACPQCLHTFPRLSPWATFCRRCAAHRFQVNAYGPLLGLRPAVRAPLSPARAKQLAARLSPARGAHFRPRLAVSESSRSTPSRGTFLLRGRPSG